MSNILDGLQCFYEREKLANEIEQSASEDEKYNALHLSCYGGRTQDVSYPSVKRNPSASHLISVPGIIT